MPTKRYRLKLEHPYAKKGTIVEVVSRTNNCISIFPTNRSKALPVYMHIPTEVEHDWLEEEVSFTKEQVEAIRRQLYPLKDEGFNKLNNWFTDHTSTEE